MEANEMAMLGLSGQSRHPMVHITSRRSRSGIQSSQPIDRMAPCGILLTTSLLRPPKMKPPATCR